MNELAPLWQLVREDVVVRYASIAGVGVLWVSIAWTSVAVLLLLPVIALGAYLYRRYRLENGIGVEEDDPDFF